MNFYRISSSMMIEEIAVVVFVLAFVIPDLCHGSLKEYNRSE